MKYYILAISLMMFLSCKQSIKKENKGAIKTQDKESGNIIEKIEEEAVEKRNSNEEIVSPTFKEVFANLNTKHAPLIETTNFDDFIEFEDFKNISSKALSLETIYPDFNKKGQNFRAISAYKTELSNQFLTIVVTIIKEKYEMETQLINYDFNGKIIDYKTVSYDEISDGMYRSQSKITNNAITINQIVWAAEPQIEQVDFNISKNGKIDKISSKVLNDKIGNIPLITTALDKLKLSMPEIKTNLITSKSHPDNPDEVIVVIPEIADEAEEIFELNSHILIINSRSGEIMQTFFESNKTNNWTSDAIRLNILGIDTAPYWVKEDIRAFGVTVEYFGSSKVNPYYNKTLSLFVKSGNNLKKILHNFSVYNSSGEWNDACDGEDSSEKKILIMSSDKTNDFFDIVVKSKIVETKSFINENGECVSNDSVINQTSVLSFDGKVYKEVKE